MKQNLKGVKMVMPPSQGLQSNSLFCPLGITSPSLGTQPSLPRPGVSVASSGGRSVSASGCLITFLPPRDTTGRCEAGKRKARSQQAAGRLDAKRKG